MDEEKQESELKIKQEMLAEFSPIVRQKIEEERKAGKLNSYIFKILTNLFTILQLK